VKKILIILTVLLTLSATSGCTLLKVSLVDEMQPLTEQVISGAGTDKVLLLDISGFITAQESGSLLGGKKQPGTLARVREELDRARQDKDVKAIVLRINSAGGGVTASDMLFHEIRKYRQETGVKVLAHVMDMGTSGAYYAALAANRIIAQPTSVLGSIGVIMFRVDASGLMQKIGVQAIEISSGERKGMGSPFRPVSAEERAIFQGMIDSLQARFVNTLAAERQLSPEAARNLADGRIYTSQEAQALGLIDGTGYVDDAITQAMKLAGIGRASIVTYSRPGEYRANLYSVNLINIDMGAMLQPGASFMYLWWP